MSSANESNATPSGAPVATAPPPRAASKSEADYLKEQAANAKAALKQTLGEIAGGFGTGVSPAKWTEEHPWAMLAGATVAGFTAACVAVPSKQQSALNRLRDLEAALRPPPEKHHESNGKKSEKKGIVAIIVAELIRAATGIVTSMLKATPMPGAMPGMAPTGADGSSNDHASSI